MTKVTEKLEEISSKAKTSITLRLFAIGMLSLLLLTPAAFVGALISERENRRQEAIREVGGRWGGEQTLAGPILHVPYRRYWKDEKGVTRTSTEMATFLPAELAVNGTVDTEVRRRGIYEAVLYRSLLTFAGRFGSVRIDEQEVAPTDVLWERAYVSIGITDTRGVDERVTLEWKGKRIDLSPGVGGSTAVAAGIHAPVPLRIGAERDGCAFAFVLHLRGHDGLHFAPIAARTTVVLRSQWPHPGFTGAFLPQRRIIRPDGFSSDWSVLDINRAFPQSWLGSGPSIGGAEFGVNLVVPVDDYQKADRAHKYALLFIAMTFVTLFFIEMLRNERVHVLNYILCGLAICLFYVLLLSFSEHVGFNAAYGIATVAITGLVSWHARNIFIQRTLCRAIGGMLALLYGFMFIMLQLNDFALLFGSVGLFAILTAVMAAASRITRGN